MSIKRDVTSTKRSYCVDGIHFWIPAVVIWVLAAYGLVSIIKEIV